MDFVRTAANPWGQEVFLGLAWDVLWLVAILGAGFVIVHAIFAKKGAEAGHAPSAELTGASAAGIPEKIVRHNKSARISHWILAATTFVLLITAFVPILGLQFPWVTIHWITGLVFGGYFVYHIFDTLARGSWGSMWLSPGEAVRAIGRVKDFFSRGSAEIRSGKWNFENKAFHHITALAGLGVLVTGLLMFMRVDTWFWEADPYVLGISDATWGLVYVVHGLAAVGFVGLLIAHIYFALRPDKLFFTRSMIKGWITREEYLEHYDPALWPAGNGRSAASGAPERTPVGAGPATSSSEGAE